VRSSSQIVLETTLALAVATALVSTGARPASAQRPSLEGLAAQVSALQAQVAGLQAKLACQSTVGTEVYFTGCNVNIRSGAGATDEGVNGLGNLVIGYNESTGQARTGSHNLIVGPRHSYSSYGGIIGGPTTPLPLPLRLRRSPAEATTARAASWRRSVAGPTISPSAVIPRSAEALRMSPQPRDRRSAAANATSRVGDLSRVANFPRTTAGAP
jgi:hypothetical protein